MAFVAATPTLLSWAREQVAMSRSEAAERLGVPVDRLNRWEEGSEEPTQTALENMARLYKRPLALFFLDKPPMAPDLPRDFRLRTVGGKQPVLDRELFLVVRQARAWQEIVARLVEVDHSLMEETQVPSASREENPERLGSALRDLLAVSQDEQLWWPSSEHALSVWRDRVEGRGVLVFAMTFSREICRGFSVWAEKGPPLIGLARESPQARTFTLMHEFAHLMLRTGGICSQFEDQSERGRTERFCNRVAAAILMPAEMVESVVKDYFPGVGASWGEETLKELADRLRVSVPAIALRLEELELSASGLYASIVSKPAPEYVPPGGGGGGEASWPGVRISERGFAYSQVIFGAWRRGLISSGDAARVMSVPVKYVSQIGDAVRRRRERLA